MQLDPKEKLGYGAIAVLIAAIAGVYGYKSSHQNTVLSTTPQPIAAVPVSPQEVVVHVVGAVKKAGVYHLPGGARAEDAVKAAGGATSAADLESVNLAAKLTDGQQLVIPVKGETASQSGSPGPKAAHSAKGKLSSGTVNLNSASSEELQTVPGIGPATADKIVQWRSAHGAFTRIEDLRKIGGIGDKKLSTMRPFLRL